MPAPSPLMPPGIDAMDRNLRAALRGFSTPGGDLDLDGVAIRFSGEDFAMFNAAVISSPVTAPEDLARRIRLAQDYYGNLRVAWSLWTCESWFDGLTQPAAAIAAFSRAGLRFVLELPGMVAARLAPPVRELPRLAYFPVSDAPSRAAFARMMTACFGIPGQIARAMYERDRLWNEGFEGWLGYAGDTLVTVAATLVDAGVAGLYSVGTLPEFERQGCGEAIVRHALGTVRDRTGIEATALQASAEGYGLYSRMGYDPVARYVVWASR